MNRRKSVVFSRRKFGTGVFTFLFFISTLVPGTAFASDMSYFVDQLSSGTVVQLSGTAFWQNPTTENFALLTQSQITAILNDLSPDMIASLPSDTFTNFSTARLTSTLTSLPATVLQSFTSDPFSMLTSGTVSGVLTALSGTAFGQATLSNLSSSFLTGLPSTILSSALNSLSTTVFGNLNLGELLAGADTGTISYVLNNLAADLFDSLASDFFTYFEDGAIVDILQDLATDVLRSFSSDFFSVLSDGTLSEILSNVSGSIMDALSGSFLTGLTTDTINNILSGLSSDILGSLGTSLFSGLTSGTISGIITSLSSSVLGSLGGSLLGGLTSGTLTSVFNTLGASAITSALGPVAGTIFNSIGGSVLGSALSGVTGGLTGVIGSALTSVIPSSILGAIPGLGGFGLFVPVFDVALVPAFAAYSSAFNAYAANMNGIISANPDSLRNIIAAGSPGGITRDDCEMGDAEDYAFAYRVGPWADAYASSSAARPPGGLPATVPETFPPNGIVTGRAGPDKVQVNKSGSLRCLLQEVVGFQKMALFVQIQSLLKQYIADAQQKQLSNQLLNKVNATNLNWAKEGEKVVSGGTETTEPVYILNSDQSQYARNARNLETVVGQAAAQPGDPAGSLELCNPLGVAAQVAKDVRYQTDDSRDFTTQVTRCTLDAATGPFASRNDLAEYLEDPNTIKNKLGSVDMLLYSMNNPQDMPLTALTLVEAETSGRIAQDEARYQRELLGSGFQPTQKCSGTPGDPYCDPALMTNVSSVAQNQATVVGAVESGKEQVADSDILDSTSANAAENLSTEANTQPGGVYGYDTTRLQSSQTGVNALIRELYDTISYAYFDLNGDQEEWAQAALLSIYDEMKFDDTKPNVVVTKDWREYYVDF